MPLAPVLEIRKLHASIIEGKQESQTKGEAPLGKEILRGVDLSISQGESHAIMGPNGSGKSTLSNVILGHPLYKVDSGDILLDGESILDWPTEKRAQKGLFLSFQYPTAIPGVTVNNFLRSALKSLRKKDIPIRDFRKELLSAMDSLEMESKFAGRHINDGFSGGEKKRTEILQLVMMKPRLAILDEIDSGLDIDALRLIAQKIEENYSPERSFLLITHYQRLLDYLSIDKVHVFMEGRILKSGGKDLAERLEKEGYDWAAKLARNS